jgi:hypothetical protein
MVRTPFRRATDEIRERTPIQRLAKEAFAVDSGAETFMKS